MPADPKAKGYIEAIPLAKGRLRAILTRYTATPAGKAPKAPYTIAITRGGYQDASRKVHAGASPSIEITLSPKP